MNVTINVTQEDINGGIPKSCLYCPIAIAVKKKLKSEFICSVGISLSIRDKETGKYLYQTDMFNHETSLFVKNFDVEYPVKPFNFKIFIPEKYLRIQTSWK